MNKSNNTRERKQQIINIAIQEYLDMPETLRSLTKVGEKYGIRRQTLSEELKKRGFEVINYQNRSRLNEHVFDVMDSEEKFYWLGFMYADGNISSTGNRIEVHLSLKDISHLEKFRKFLNLTTEIRTGTDKRGISFCHLSVRNKHLWTTLYNLGCTPRKSLTLRFPNISIFKNKENILHFIRGYVDGDGCLCTYKSSNGSINTNVNLVGTENFLKSINKLFGNKGYIKNKSCTNWENKAYSLSFSSVPSRKLARYLYENATIYLDRKYLKYLEFCRIEEESSRRKSSKIGEGCDANPEVSSEIAKGSETPQSVESE